MGKKIEVLSGTKINFFTVIKEVEVKKEKRRFLCECECGTQKEVSLNSLRTKKTISCGCKKIKHGDCFTRLYKIWNGIKRRCLTPTCSIYYKYGAKGITICDEWHDYLNFKKWALSNGYKDSLTIDRIDGQKSYTPDNCRWTDYTAQNTNLGMLKNNTSGYKGVSWSKKDRKWQVVISIKNKSVRVGGFSDIIEACKARNKFIEDNNLPHQKIIF